MPPSGPYTNGAARTRGPVSYTEKTSSVDISGKAEKLLLTQDRMFPSLPKKKKKFSSDRRKIPISNNNETDSTNILEDFRGSRSKMSTTAGNKVDVIPPPDNIGALQMI